MNNLYDLKLIIIEPSAPPTDVTVEARGAGTLRVKWKVRIIFFFNIFLMHIATKV